MNPSVTFTEMTRLYALADYWGEAYTNYEESEPIRIANARLFLRRVLPFVPANGKLLDVGCATGFFAQVAAEHGFSVVGIDPSQRMIDFGKARYGLDLRCCSVEEAVFGSESFDIISLWGTDSHFYKPRAAFSKMLGWLKPGGRFLFSYQDYAHWLRILFPAIKRGWNVYYNFTSRSFREFAGQLALRIVFEATAIQITQISRIVKATKKMAHPVPAWLANLTIRIPAPSYKIVVARKS